MMIITVIFFIMMMVSLIVIMLADMDGISQIIAVILLSFSLTLYCANTSFSVEQGKEIVLNSISTQYTRTELYNMSDAEKDLLLKTYGGAITKYWKIEGKINESRRSL